MPSIVTITENPSGSNLYVHDAVSGVRSAKVPYSPPAAGAQVESVKYLGGKILVLSVLVDDVDFTYYLSEISADFSTVSTRLTTTSTYDRFEIIYTDKFVALAGNNIITSEDLVTWETEYVPVREVKVLVFGDGEYRMHGLPIGAETDPEFTLSSTDLTTWSTTPRIGTTVGLHNGTVLEYGITGVFPEGVYADGATLAFEVYELPRMHVTVGDKIYIGGFAGYPS